MPTLHIDASDLKKLMGGETIQHPATGLRIVLDREPAEIGWEVTREDFDLLLLVADRALRELNNYPDDKRTLVMDLNACHSNGCALDFAGLLKASLYELSHDICGIRKAINRDTGKLTEDRFMPRYALANRVPEGA